MNFFTIPARNDLPSYKFKCSLSGVIYTIRMHYNSRTLTWMMDVADSSDNSILVGLPVLINRNLTGQFVVTGLPVGTIFATDDTNANTQPGRYSFGTDHTLFYADPTTNGP